MLHLTSLLLIILINVVEAADMVSISVVGHTGPMIEGTWYELRCDVQKVAPDQLLTVRWYKGQTLLTDTSFNDSIKTPVDKSATYWIFANTTDDGAEYRCEAVLRQRQAGPQPPTTEMSEPLLVTVYCNCPVVLQPPAVVVEYGTSVSANCSTSKPHFGMAWEVPQGAVDLREDVQLITWNLSRLEDWDIKPLCYINIKNQTKPDKRHLPVIVYKTPDSVSISIVGHTGPVTEGTQYELQCDVQNVAPVHRLTVKWYKGQTLLTDTFFNDPTKTPVNQSATLQISPSRADDAADYWCEAELRLGPAAPQPPPTMKSDPLNITVYYAPQIVSRMNSVLVPILSDVSLNCSAEGNPEPTVMWSFKNQTIITGRRQSTLTISRATSADAGIYTCTATSLSWSQTREVKVEEDYRFLLISVFIIVFIIIFLIILVAYKKKRTRNYVRPMIEGTWYELRCDVQKVAPDPLLTVRWYKGQTLLTDTSFNDSIKTPVDKSATYWIFANTTDDGAEYRCEAVLRQRQAGPQPPTTKMSEPLLVTVYLYYSYILIYSSSSSSSSPSSSPSLLVCWVKGTMLHLTSLLLIILINVVEAADMVSISVVGHTGPMVEGTWYELRCDVQKVAPDQLLTVRWYKGQTLLTDTSFNDSIKTPVDKSATYWIFANTTDNGAEYRCEAVLRQRQAGPQPPTTEMSEPLLVTVYCNCPVVLQPPAVVVEYGTSVSANCSTSKSHFGMAWEVPQGAVDPQEGVQLITWNLSRLEDWDIKPLCYINIKNQTKPDKRHLPVIVYKTPDSVSISIVGHTGPVIEGTQYELQCDVQNVAPVHRLTVRWYKGQTLLTDTFFNDPTKTPVNQSATLQISPSRADDAADYWCEAELRLGPAAPQPPPTMKSDPLNITVYYAPQIVSRMNSVLVPIFSDVSLNCSAEGNPEPTVMWSFKNQTIITGRRQSTLTISRATSADAGIYTCTATSLSWSQTREVKVEEDYRFLLISVFIIVFIIIFLIILVAYKKKRTRNYVT
ncbi:vascular cell adhesion protein 1-like [Electrophorus electricus]|uniref:vascular cell adhesion protein 1-like n=1 Tax=Electrophorus electricus TaxID=8005 RepID=UPI0015CFC741|nr:vascular cell adhesion protein 1-like [Electrophorus electricus]